MLTTAVGFVDRAANEETWLVTKRDEGMASKDDGGSEGGLRLPAAAKQSLTDGIADALEKLSAVAQQIAACQVDEGAECPPELAAQIDELADDLDELADEFMPEASPAQMGAKGAARKANNVAKAKAGKPFPGAAPPFKSKEDEEDEEAEKAGKPFPGAAPPFKSKEDESAVAKSGRKMARDRLESLQKGHAAHGEAMDHLAKAAACMKDGHGAIAQVLKEVGDPAPAQPPSPAPDAPPPSPKPPGVEPDVGAAKASEVAKAAVDAAKASEVAKAAVDAALAGPLAQLSSTLEGLKVVSKSIADTSAMETLRGLAGTPRSQPSEGGPPPPRHKQQPWPADMSAELKKTNAK